MATQWDCDGSPIVSAPRIDHEFQQHAHVEARAADQEIVGRPLAVRVLAPGLAQPGAIRFEAAGRQHASARLDTLGSDACRHEASVAQFDRIDRRVVANRHAQGFGTAIVRVDQRLAATHEKRIGARHVECAGKRRLEMHAVLAHPVAAGRRGADREARELFVGDAAGDLEQVLPEFLFRIGVHEDILRCLVHAAEVARVLRIAAAPFAWRGFEQHDAGTGFACHQRRAQRSVAATDHQHIHHRYWLPSGYDCSCCRRTAPASPVESAALQCSKERGTSIERGRHDRCGRRRPPFVRTELVRVSPGKFGAE